jgi:hypothetical protein
MDGQRFRLHVTMGWKMRTDLTEGEKQGIEDYIAHGNPVSLPLRYARLRDVLRDHNNPARNNL